MHTPCATKTWPIFFLLFAHILSGDINAETPPRPAPDSGLPIIRKVLCAVGPHPGHLQGLATDGKHVYWAFTEELIKTDAQGAILLRAQVPTHHGGVTYFSGKLYVAFFSPPSNQVKVYDASNFVLVNEHELDVFEDYIGTVAYHDQRFYVGEDFVAGKKKLRIHEYDLSFTYVRTHVVDVTLTKGFENLARFADHWWGSTYDFDVPMLKMDDSFQVIERFPFGFPFGMVGWNADVALTGRLPDEARWIRYDRGARWQPEWPVTYEGDALPESEGWIRSGSGEATLLKFGALHYRAMATNGRDDHDSQRVKILWSRELAPSLGIGATIEARMKVVGKQGGIWRVTQDTRHEKPCNLSIEFYDDQIGIRNVTHPTRYHAMRTTDDYHIYRLACKNWDYSFYVDGQLVFDGFGKNHADTEAGVTLTFGAQPQSGTHEAMIDYIRAHDQAAYAPPDVAKTTD